MLGQGLPERVEAGEVHAEDAHDHEQQHAAEAAEELEGEPRPQQRRDDRERVVRERHAARRRREERVRVRLGAALARRAVLGLLRRQDLDAERDGAAPAHAPPPHVVVRHRDPLRRVVDVAEAHELLQLLHEEGGLLVRVRVGHGRARGPLLLLRLLLLLLLRGQQRVRRLVARGRLLGLLAVPAPPLVAVVAVAAVVVVVVVVVVEFWEKKLEKKFRSFSRYILAGFL